jgi:hypothetical protein
MSILRRAFLASLALAAITGPLSAQTKPDEAPPAASASSPGQETMEQPQTGDHWTYELRDEITGDIKATITNTVTDASGSDISVRTGSLGNSDYDYETFDRSWNMTDGGAWRYVPNDGAGMKTPLAVGDTWSFEATDINNIANVRWKRSGTSKVLARENVTTRAGTFDAFKVEATIQEQNVDDPTSSIQLVQQTWYAPAINHWVKRTAVAQSDGQVRGNSTIELVEYGRR